MHCDGDTYIVRLLIEVISYIDIVILLCHVPWLVVIPAVWCCVGQVLPSHPMYVDLTTELAIPAEPLHSPLETRRRPVPHAGQALRPCSHAVKDGTQLARE